jgi:hypothetical protein
VAGAVAETPFRALAALGGERLRHHDPEYLADGGKGDLAHQVGVAGELRAAERLPRCNGAGSSRRLLLPIPLTGATLQRGGQP